MFSATGKLRETVQTAGDSIRQAAEGTGKLVIAALAVASGAFLLALAALVAVLKVRKVAA